MDYYLQNDNDSEMLLYFEWTIIKGIKRNYIKLYS